MRTAWSRLLKGAGFKATKVRTRTYTMEGIHFARGTYRLALVPGECATMTIELFEGSDEYNAARERFAKLADR